MLQRFPLQSNSGLEGDARIPVSQTVTEQHIKGHCWHKLLQYICSYFKQ